MIKRKILIFLMIISFGFSNIYADVTTDLFQNSFNNDLSNIPAPEPRKSSNKKQFVNKTVAIVNDTPITAIDLDQELTRLKQSIPPAQAFKIDELELKKEALQNLISRSVLIQLAERNNIQIPNSEVDRTIDDIANRNGVSIDSLKLNIEASGMSFDQYRKKIKEQLMINQIQQQAIAQQVYVSPKEIQRYIEKHKDSFKRQMTPKKKYILKNIIISTPKSKILANKKNNLLKKLAMAVDDKYINFADAANLISQAPNASQGGAMGQPLEFDLIPEMYKSQVKKLEKGQSSKPFKINKTMQMIYVDNIDEDKPLISKEVVQYHAYAIVINLTDSMTSEGAESTLSRARLAIDGSEKFSTVAEKYNQNYDHQNGDFGWVSLMDKPPIIPPAAFTELGKLKKGQLSEPFQADPKTWMIIKYTQTKDYDASKEIEEQKALEAIFSEKAQEIYKTWITAIQDEAYVKILEDDLKTEELY